MKDSFPTLEPSGIGEAVRHNLSPAYINMRFRDPQEIEQRHWLEAFSPLSPLQAQVGDEFEQEVYDKLVPLSETVIDKWRDYGEQHKNDKRIREEVKRVQQKNADSEDITLLLQARLAGEVGPFYVAGDADLVALWPTEEGVHIRVIDIKSSWDEKPYQQIQAATYVVLLEQILPSEGVSVDAGILYRESEYSTLSTDSLPSFETDSRVGDLKQLLDEDGPFAYALSQDISSVPITAGPRAEGVDFAEIFNVLAVERESPGILGLTRGEQTTLSNEGITTLGELASLYEKPESPRPYNHEKPPVNRDHEETVENLEEAYRLDSSLHILCQRAQAILGVIDPDHQYSDDTPWVNWIQGSGVARLPEDDPNYNVDNGIPENGLVRIYLNVQEDYVRDRVALLSAHVTCTRAGTEETIVEYSETFPRKDEAAAEVEKNILESFADQLFWDIEEVAKSAGYRDSGVLEAPIHFYTYTEGEQEFLEEATARHRQDSSIIEALHTLLTMREGIDQMMFSALKPEVEERMALRHPVTGIVPVVNQLSPRNNDDAFSGWSYNRDDGTSVDLSQAFGFGMLRSLRPIDRDTGFEDVDDADTFMHVLPRYDAQIPLEYIWSATGDFGPSWVSDSRKQEFVEKYRWVDSNTKSQQVTVEDVAALSKKLTKAVRHVERTLDYRDTHIQKPRLPVSDLHSFSRENADLATACRDYLDLEYHSQRREAFKTYQTPLKERIRSGSSAPFRITDVDEKDYMIKIEGELMYDEFSFNSPQQIAESSSITGSDGGGSSGSWLVATPLSEEQNEYTTDVKDPLHVEHSTPVTVSSFDPRNGTIELDSYMVSRSGDDRYTTWYHRWTTEDDGGSDYYFGEGQEFVLDPSASMGPAEKSLTSIETADGNDTYNTMQRLRNGTIEQTTYSKFSEKDIEAYLEWVENHWPFSPNSKQREFITSVDNQFVLLQGPPGTGKTSGGLSHAITSRLVAAEQNEESLAGLVSGSSNKSVDEILEDVSEIVQAYERTGDGLDDVELVRLVLEEPEEKLAGVTYLNYNDADEALDTLETRINPSRERRQSSLAEHASDSVPQTVIFGTPGRVQKMISEMHERIDIETLYRGGADVFDLFAVDEASMMPLTDLLTCTALVAEDAQHLISGDQRQMPPVQSYEWEDESRPSIRNQLPYLSTLDYFRFLRGDDLGIDEDELLVEQPSASIPLVQLEQTYRCHEDVARFLREWMYAKDDLEYFSRETATMDQPAASTSGIQSVLNPDSPLTLVVHDDTSSNKVNFAEATAVNHVVRNIPETESIGIVVPHNAQKGLVSTITGERATTDTVERFQGGERDVVIVSATVSDPEFLEAESKFILNPNRINVAMSRMKKKLIVVVPLSLLQHIPADTEEYDDARLWKGLYKTFSVSEEAPDWNGTLQELVGQEGVPNSDTTFSVHSS